ncbi:ABC transporter permease [Intestinimonas massiliensis]|uniref:ABC transporter permease n=1 Tax=Intestinimonas massiliensis (ex Afouda et al. 2020) TaxID=1673721 RepID=A0AAW5JLY7_9FIRM|nr:ABC transporter permease [Intestinimonas massiliensis (ex Afouda et al. 2020)]MCQ4769561.1 ABC transporter permease [Intestinimonas massiliensis (ex Afouda et al. 2020)]
MKKARNSFFYIGGGISLVMTLLILMGYIWTPYSPTQMDASAQMQAPSLQHLLGTDNFGRDIFSRVLQGAGTSFLIAVSVVAIGCLAGILVGSLCGYYGGTADVILTRVCDSITAFPSILLALVIVSVVGSGTYNIILALGILFIPSFARIVRGEFARCRHLNYIQSAKLMGVGDARILFSHILPNTFSVLLPAITIGFNNAILSEASMSFLGIGIQPPHASLGSMLNDSQTYLRSAPWYALSVGGTIVLLILGFSLLGEGLQQRGRRN